MCGGITKSKVHRASSSITTSHLTKNFPIDYPVHIVYLENYAHDV